MLEDSRARLLVVSEELYPKFAKALAASAEPPHVIVSGSDTHGHAQFEALLAGAEGHSAGAPKHHDFPRSAPIIEVGSYC
jgi:hypothetical protein